MNQIPDDRGYVLASRQHQLNDTLVRVGDSTFGGNSFVVIAGPCAVESMEQIMTCAQSVRVNRGAILRGGCFKPRTSPYSFQGLGVSGVNLLQEAGKAYGLPTITEVMSVEDLGLVSGKVDILQVGARNMHNFSLLKAVGKSRWPVLLKRAVSSSIDELLQAAEYILAQGNPNVILCERGIRTFEQSTRSTLDLSAVPVLKRKTHLPIIVDPSHAAGDRELVPPLSLAAKAVGAHGIMVEIHPDPEHALSDGPQALHLPTFAELMDQLIPSDTYQDHLTSALQPSASRYRPLPRSTPPI